MYYKIETTDGEAFLKIKRNSYSIIDIPFDGPVRIIKYDYPFRIYSNDRLLKSTAYEWNLMITKALFSITD